MMVVNERVAAFTSGSLWGNWAVLESHFEESTRHPTPHAALCHSSWSGCGNRCGFLVGGRTEMLQVNWIAERKRCSVARGMAPRGWRATRLLETRSLQMCRESQSKESLTEMMDKNEASSPLRMIVIGPPASGKTTLTEMLRRAYGLVRVGCGDILRAHALYNTELGKRAKPYLDAHELVPDEIVIPLVLERLSQRDCRVSGWVLDGFPRNTAQVHALQEMYENESSRHQENITAYPLGTVFVLDADDGRLLSRMRSRRVDPDTHLVYNLISNPPSEEEVLERLLELAMDSQEAFSHRMKQYRSSLKPLLETITLCNRKRNGVSDAKSMTNIISIDVTELGVQDAFRVLMTRLCELRAIAVPDIGNADASAVGEGAVLRRMASLNATKNNPQDNENAYHRPSRLNDGTDRDALPRKKERKQAGSNGLEQELLTRDTKQDAENSLSASRSTPVPERGVNDKKQDLSPKPQDKKPVPKSSLTLIRCDGVQCVRESTHKGNIAFHGSATEQVMLRWNERPRTVLLLVKKGAHLTGVAKRAAEHLRSTEHLHVLVEPWIQTELFALGTYVDSFHSTDDLHSMVDFVVCLGGDGLVLHTSTLFKSAVPPVISFNLGSLGFLTPFEWEQFPRDIRTVLEGDVMLSLRMRLLTTVIRGKDGRSREFHVLNEVVVDRGASPFLCQLDCFWDDEPLANVQADGIILATPTGSTAYSLAAGGAMVHPSVPAICFTPVCPHSLGLRPLVLPDSARIRVDVSLDARSHAWASFDGKNRQQLRRGDSLLVEMSKYPMPTVNATDQTADWFGSLSRGFGFSVRGARQKPRGSNAATTAELARGETDLPSKNNVEERHPDSVP